MRVMVFVKATEASEDGVIASPEAFEAMGKFNTELANAGILLAADGLTASSEGKRVAFDGASRTVIDGPFAEARELVAGFWIWEVKDMDEAVAWVKRCPNPMADRARSKSGHSSTWPISWRPSRRSSRNGATACARSSAAPSARRALSAVSEPEPAGRNRKMPSPRPG